MVTSLPSHGMNPSMDVENENMDDDLYDRKIVVSSLDKWFVKIQWCSGKRSRIFSRTSLPWISIVLPRLCTISQKLWPSVVYCDDYDACTTDGCDDETVCRHTNIDCDDGNPCTINNCDESTGCTYTPFVCAEPDACHTVCCEWWDVLNKKSICHYFD